MRLAKRSIYDLSPDQLASFFQSHGESAFRTKQVFDWLYAKRVSSFDEMDNLPRSLRELLAEHFRVQRLEKLETNSIKTGTQKLLFKLADEECIETVIIPASKRPKNTVCISCQVGCLFGCKFCASGQKGVIRNLTAGEMVGEVLEVARELGKRPNNVVFMGIGEPFDNYDEVMHAIRIMNHPDGLGIGARHITVSTCGVVPGIRRFAEEGLQVELSVSLHAPDEETRSSLMPVNESWPLDELMSACEEYTAKTNRIITFEYTLIKNINDSLPQANEMLKRLRTFPCRVNLIPLSSIEEFEGERSPSKTMRAFFQTLEKGGVHVTLRNSKGSDLEAACGQLRAHRH